MRNPTIAIALTLAMATGCTAAKSALSALSPKPNNTTVVNTTTIEPASVVVNVPAPVVMVSPIVPAPIVIVQTEAPRKSRFGALKAAASGAVAGAVVGTLVGYAVGGNQGAGKGAALGAGAGAVGGAVAHQAQ